MKIIALLMAIIATTCAQTGPTCRCSAFVSTFMIYNEHEAPIASCDTPDLCKQRCVRLLNNFSNNGDLLATDGSGTPLGEYLCGILPEIRDRKLYGHYSVCGGPMQYAGVETKQKLCCKNRQQEPCLSQ